MKKFKLIFHIFYILIALVLLYFSIDILMNTQDYLLKIKLSSYIKYFSHVMSVFLFISILMIIGFVLQQLSIYQAKGNVGKLEEEILQLKARLYDRSHEADEEEEIDSVADEEGED